MSDVDPANVHVYTCDVYAEAVLVVAEDDVEADEKFAERRDDDDYDDAGWYYEGTLDVFLNRASRNEDDVAWIV